jgi:hypothetical protein
LNLKNVIQTRFKILRLNIQQGTVRVLNDQAVKSPCLLARLPEYSNFHTINVLIQHYLQNHFLPLVYYRLSTCSFCPVMDTSFRSVKLPTTVKYINSYDRMHSNNCLLFMYKLNNDVNIVVAKPSRNFSVFSLPQQFM